MNELADKGILFLICICCYLADGYQGYEIGIMLFVVIISACFSYFEYEKLTWGIFLLFIAICLFQKDFILFLPVVSYDLFAKRGKQLYLLFLLLFAAEGFYMDAMSFTGVVPILLLAVAFLLQQRNTSLDRIKKEYNQFKDQMRESSRMFAMKNKELLEKQDYEKHVATLSERNRISREIHDNVGHLLSSAILQTGALIALTPQQDEKEKLSVLKETLSNAMDSVRMSVHGLHEKSVDLYAEIKTITDKFTFCPLELRYEIEEMEEKDIKYCFIQAVKEGLSNIIKHSDATKVTIIADEHPVFYQLIVKDNGNKKNTEGKNFADILTEGMGISGIMERVEALSGNVYISEEDGFRIFVSIPKKQK